MLQHLSFHCNLQIFCPSTTPCHTFTLILKTDGPGMFLFDYFSPDPAWLGGLQCDDVATSLDLNNQKENEKSVSAVPRHSSHLAQQVIRTFSTQLRVTTFFRFLLGECYQL